MESDYAATGPLSVADLFALEEYHRLRPDFRAKVIAHKKPRQVAVGADVMLYFEDRLTIQYQVQEMLRIERIFEREAIEEELGAYNPLIPDGTNLKATFMIQIPDSEERRRRLAMLSGIEDCLYARIGENERITCVADEDLERSEPDKTSAVHFVRFQFSKSQRDELRAGAQLAFGIDHPNYEAESRLGEASRLALISDLA